MQENSTRSSAMAEGPCDGRALSVKISSTVAEMYEISQLKKLQPANILQITQGHRNCCCIVPCCNLHRFEIHFCNVHDCL